MTPEQRDRNVFRARRITSAIAGVALAACGLFAGLAASATRHTVKATATTATTTTTAAEQGESDDSAPATTTTIAPVVVTPTPSAPVASSGGS
ncbi:MAG: hypothetical protein E6F98_13800 [Actinobacteria bacterium]|jgi:hypothetical protein|nr:MAG: hypothetical protein E6F98_13800 [Actinomycetota bacterium]